MQEKPEYIINFQRPKNTEIKYINGHWYLYERSSRYDPKTKKMHKVSGQLLGSITEEGFKPKKQKIDHKIFENVEVVELGATGYLWMKNQELANQLQKHFPDYWRELFIISALRIVNGSRFKRLEEAYETSCLSKLLPNADIGKNELTSMLHSLGKRRGEMQKFMLEESDKLSSYMIFDGHRIISDSGTLENAAMGYDSRRRFKNQVNLIYAFSVNSERCFPYYYKQFSGDIPDISAFSSMIEETGIKKESLTVLADKGFGSDDNFTLLEECNLKYIIPIKRTNGDSKFNIPTSFVDYDDCFSYHNRSVLHKAILKEDCTVHIFLDTFLFANEMNDFTQRLEKKNNTTAIQKQKEEERRKKGKTRMSEEEFSALQPVDFKDAFVDRIGVGTITLKTNDKNLNAVQVYSLYKKRQAIEEFFKVYDDSLDFNSSYMRDNYTEEAWLFLNHLSSIMAFNILDEIYLRDKSKTISLNDFISTLSKVFADKAGNDWYCAKITKKKADFIKLFNLDLSALISEMNAMNVLM